MLELRLLGCLELRDPRGQEMPSVLSHSKHLAVLSYLAVEVPRAFVRRDRLLALLWGESDTAHARNSLNQAVHALRKALGRSVLLSRGRHELGLGRGTVWSDVQAFEDAVSCGDPIHALALYGGDFLAGFHLPAAPDFEHWVAGHRLRLREMAAAAGWAVAHERLGAGALTAAERVAQRALRLLATNESEVRSFISALAGAGDRAAAVKFYEHFRRLLDDELQLEPSGETRQVVSGIRGKTPRGVMAEPATGMETNSPAVDRRGDGPRTPVAPEELERSRPERPRPVTTPRRLRGVWRRCRPSGQRWPW